MQDPPYLFVKRAARTYGRRRDPLPEVDSPFKDSADENSFSRSSTSSELDEEVPPSSDTCEVSDLSNTTMDVDANDEDKTDASSSFQFDWKKKVKALDSMSDSEVAAISSKYKERMVSSPVPLQIENADLVTPHSPRGVETPFKDVFEGELPELTSSSQPQSSPSKPPSPSPSPSPAVRSRIKKRNRTVRDSDQDLDSPRPVRTSSPTSPSHPDPIVTPKLHSSPTPPTSDEDMPPLREKGKRKAQDAMHSVLDEDLASDIEVRKRKRNVKGKGKQKQTKIKAPTKKELQEITKERQRLNADRVVTIPRASVSGQHNIQNLLKRLDTSLITKPLSNVPSSDPIGQFSSSPAVGAPTEENYDEHSGPSTSSFGEPVPGLLQSGRSSMYRSPRKRGGMPLPESLESDEELPDILDILDGENARLADQERARLLAETKKRALAEAQLYPQVDDSDDDLVVESDMHNVAEEEADERRHRAKLSEGKKRQLMFGRVRPSIGRRENRVSPVKKPGGNSFDMLIAGAQSSFGSPSKAAKGKGKARNSYGSHSDLLRATKARADVAGASIIKTKDDEWARASGKVVFEQPAKDISSIVASLVDKRAAIQTEADGDDELEDGSDDEWMPEMRGSASPEPGELEDDETLEVSGLENEDTMDTRTETGDEDAETYRPRAPRRSAGRSRAVLDSDDDETDGIQPFWGQTPGRLGKVLVPDSSLAKIPSVHRGSISSFGDRTEDDTDKENDTQLMFDKSEDKENKAIVRLTLGSRPSFSAPSGSPEESPRRELVLSPSSRISDERLLRAPLKELAKEKDISEDVFGSSPAGKSNLVKAPPGPLRFSLSPVPGGISRLLSDDENDENIFLVKRSSQGNGFSQVFGRENQSLSPQLIRAVKGGDSSEFFSSQGEKSGLDKLRKSDDFSLSLDIQPKPSLKVDAKLRREADNIFEKEQEYVVEATNWRSPKQDPIQYLLPNGFVTQTRPDTSPVIYHPPTPSQAISSGTPRNSSQRHPLSTLLLTSDDLEFEDTPAPKYLKRLQRRNRSTSPSPQKPSAFEVLLKGTLKQEQRSETRKLGKSEFVEAEAEESDEDDVFGFGPRKPKHNDDEADGEDQDAILEELVDDAVMDDKTQALDLVLEKVQEHQEEDDRANEKLHRDAVEGKLRNKRRIRGIDLDDDSSEEDDDELRRLRQRMHKKRKIDDDKLDDLGKDKETRPFYDAYQLNLVDDNDEFLHLQQDDAPGDVQEESDDEEPRQVVSVNEVRKQVQEMARRKEFTDEALDLNDVAWVDGDGSEEEEDIRIKTVSYSSNSKQPRRSAPDFDGTFEQYHKQSAESDPLRRTKLATWAKSEGRSLKTVGTGRSAVGAAVTGHSKSNVKAGGGSLQNGQQVASSSRAAEQRKLAKAPSVLAAVSNKSSRFA